MQLRIPAFGFFLIATILCTPAADAADSASAPGNLPDDWVYVEAYDFRILAPPGTRFESLQGIDSAVGEFVGHDFTLDFDLGIYAPNFRRIREDLGSAAETLTIDGKEAIFVDFAGDPEENGCVGTDVNANYLNLYEELGAEVTLWIMGCSGDPATVEIMRKMVRTVDFAPYNGE